MVCFNLKPRLCETDVNRLDVKFVPLSVANVSGIPYLLIHEIRALAQHSVEAEVMGIASGQHVALSIIVNRYV